MSFVGELLPASCSVGDLLIYQLAHLGHKKLNFDCFEYFRKFFLLKYELTQVQVIKLYYQHQIKTINLLEWVLRGDNIIST